MRAFAFVILGSLVAASTVGCSSNDLAQQNESEIAAAPRLSAVKLFEVEPVRALLPSYGRPLAFDDDTMYFTFGAELYRAPLSTIDDVRTRHSVVRGDSLVTYVDVQDGVLFTIEREYDVWDPNAVQPDPAQWKGYLHVSSDKGKTFEAIDRDLKSCISFDGVDYCSPLASGVMARKVGDTIYYSAGNYPNLFATKDRGRTWHTVLGEKSDRSAMAATFDIDGARLLVTADVNDDGHFEKYTLTADRLHVVSARGADVVPGLGYRQGYFFARRAGEKRTFVGMEGGVVRSDAQGDQWRFVMEKETFITSLAFLDDKRVVVAGNPKTGGTPTMALSGDDGTTWSDVTPKLEAAIRAIDPRVSFRDVAVRGLGRAPNGKVYMVYTVTPPAGSRSKKRGVLAELIIDGR